MVSECGSAGSPCRVGLQPDSAHLEGRPGSETWDGGGEKGHLGKVQRQVSHTGWMACGHKPVHTPQTKAVTFGTSILQNTIMGPKTLRSTLCTEWGRALGITRSRKAAQWCGGLALGPGCWMQILAPHLAGWVPLGKEINFSAPQRPHLSGVDNKTPNLTRSW